MVQEVGVGLDLPDVQPLPLSLGLSELLEHYLHAALSCERLCELLALGAGKAREYFREIKIRLEKQEEGSACIALWKECLEGVCR